MRFYTVLASRPQYYDRNPLATSIGYVAGGVTPHAQVERARYTVPANRKAYVEAVHTEIFRDTAATVSGLANAFVQYLPNGGGGYYVGDARTLNIALGTQDREVIAGSIFMNAADAIRLMTSDVSTNGSFTYVLAINIIEFDA